MGKKKEVSFSKFAELCKKLESLSSNISMRNELARFFKDVPSSSVKISSYFLLGNIGPKYGDIDLGLGNKTGIRIVAQAFGRDEKDVKKSFGKKGDLGDVAESFNSRKRSALTLEEVFEELRKIKKASGKGSQGKKTRILAELLSNSSSPESKYIMRIAMQTLRLGVGEMTILEAFAQAFTKDVENKKGIENSYNVCTDIGKLGESLSEHGMEGAKRFSISLGRPVQMMLAQRVKKVSEILEHLDSDEIAAEEKYDGERVQVHKEGREIQLFSRRLQDITDQYPDIVKHLKGNIKSKEAVLDGEIVAYKNGKILPFQKLMHRRRKYDVEKYAEKYPAAVFLFDIIYANGHSYLKKPYPKRREKLEKITEQSKKVKLANRKVSKKFDDIKEFFKKCVNKGLEGIIVKSTAKKSLYQPGNRGWLWIKWKKEYAEGMQETFDVVIAGSYHGRGKRKGGFGALLCAVRNRQNDKFATFTKVGTGFTDKDFENLSRKLKKIKVKEKPRRLNVKKGMKPDSYCELTMVIEVMGAEITRSPAHTAGAEKGKGLALRFPRFLRVREDKSANQATTVNEIKQLAKK